jgi:hypothetical protein
MQGFRNFKDQIGNNHSQPQNNTVLSVIFISKAPNTRLERRKRKGETPAS